MIPSVNDRSGRERKQRAFSATKKTAYLGLCLALALICSYVEALIPFSIGIPGVRLGLTNIVIVGVLYLSNWRDALFVSVSRVLLAGFFFGSLYSILYSFAGALLSLFVMAIIKKTEKLHLISVSAAGGVAHNVGQFLVAALVVENYRILYYLPVLFLVGMVTGVLIGVAAASVLKRLSPALRNMYKDSAFS
ncbi:MAG: Gx transporter family protein [Lachnospiraceae bacterium]|nr:Gx transporter family protein [bacterium]MDY5518313.1 Gx transporter family protein [Lachnospiraceae bacterium]